jgi:hypothetical protein
MVTTGALPMFTESQVGKVNANRVGEYPPGCLLVTWLDTALSDPHGFNLVQGADGNFYRAVNTKTGAGIYGESLVAISDLAGVEVVPFVRPMLPALPRLPPPSPDGFTFPGEEFAIEGKDALRVTGTVMYRAVPVADSCPVIVEGTLPPPG